MSIKANIFYSVSADSVHKKVSSEFKQIVKLSKKNNTLYTVFAFPGMKGESTLIINSKTLNKSLSKNKKDNQNIIVIAHGFTKESREILHQLDAIVFSKSDYFWSDASLKAIT